MPVIIQPLPVLPITTGPYHHFFGYYDKTPWNLSGRYILGLRVDFIDRSPTKDDLATIGVIDTADANRWYSIATTRAWNWQQGAMVQWLEASPHDTIIFNDRIEGRFVSVIMNIFTGKRQILPLPIAAVSKDGSLALSVNFSRLHDVRPGYGYLGVADPWEEKDYPQEDGIYLLDIQRKSAKLLIPLYEVASYSPTSSMQGVKHWINHLQFNPNTSRFLFLHRWKRPQGSHWWWWTRLFTANVDGSNMFCVAEYDLISHFDWIDQEKIIAWCRRNKAERESYYILQDFSGLSEAIADELFFSDGHCSVSPCKKWIMTDTYANSDNIQTLMLYNYKSNTRIDIGQFYASPDGGELRCDLHPRWNRDGTQICIDSIHTKQRQMYTIDISVVVNSITYK